MIAADRDWRAVPGATPEQLTRLRAASPVELPDSYYRLLAFSNGGEGPLSVQPYYFLLDSADMVADAIRDRLYDEEFDGFLIFVSNGGGEYIAFDTRDGAPWSVVFVDMVAGSESAAVVAPNFDAFVDLIGIESADA